MRKGNRVATVYPPAFVRKEVDGKKVIKDEVMPSNLPPRADGSRPPMHTIRVLTLEDGSVLYGCRDCETTGDTPGVIRAHRNKRHGVASSTRKSPVNDAPDSSPPLPIPSADMLGMTMYEMLELGANIARWEKIFGNQEQEVERLRALLTEKDTELAEARRLLKTEEREHDRTKARIARVLGLEKPEDKP
jgi:hypothetical protein